MIIDITDKVSFEGNDDESLPITKCICGAEFKAWSFSISIYKENPKQCPACGRKLFFKPMIRVYEITN